MPFNPDEEHTRLSNLLTAASRLKRDLGDTATLEDAIDQRKYHEEEAEWLYEAEVQPLREKEDLTDAERSQLRNAETDMEAHAGEAEQLKRDIDHLTTSDAADMSTPLMELCQALKKEMRRLERYMQTA
jgi:hypothetical protein